MEIKRKKGKTDDMKQTENNSNKYVKKNVSIKCQDGDVLSGAEMMQKMEDMFNEVFRTDIDVRDYGDPLIDKWHNSVSCKEADVDKFNYATVYDNGKPVFAMVWDETEGWTLNEFRHCIPNKPTKHLRNYCKTVLGIYPNY